MRYYKQTADGYITAIGTGRTGGETITREEYAAIVAAMATRPTPEDGNYYRLTDRLTWESAELERSGVYTRAELEEMSNAELETILWQYGITANMTKANLIRLILSAQGGGLDA
mgnify:FL=1